MPSSPYRTIARRLAELRNAGAPYGQAPMRERSREALESFLARNAPSSQSAQAAQRRVREAECDALILRATTSGDYRPGNLKRDT